jgi:hypothetical protein
MGAGVTRQCSRNRCLARWTVWIPHRDRRGRAGRANSKKDLVTGPIEVFVPYTLSFPSGVVSPTYSRLGASNGAGALARRSERGQLTEDLG